MRLAELAIAMTGAAGRAKRPRSNRTKAGKVIPWPNAGTREHRAVPAPLLTHHEKTTGREFLGNLLK